MLLRGIVSSVGSTFRPLRGSSEAGRHQVAVTVEDVIHRPVPDPLASSAGRARQQS